MNVSIYISIYIKCMTVCMCVRMYIHKMYDLVCMYVYT